MSRFRLFAVAMALGLPILSFTDWATAGGFCGCRRCVVCCQCGSCGGHRGDEPAPKSAKIRAADPVAAPIVQSMPVFSMPMMFASMPVMPAMATMPQTSSRSAAGGSDCCDRVDRLEDEMIRLAKSVNQLQAIVEGQTKVLEKLSEGK